ncbi:MAG TPA: hypothetical protein VGH84_07575, partial [Steroidobacteraceae bacterium]
GRVVDERIDAAPERIGDVDDVRFAEGDGYVAVGMGIAIIFEAQRGTVERQAMPIGEDLVGQPARCNTNGPMG